MPAPIRFALVAVTPTRVVLTGASVARVTVVGGTPVRSLPFQ